MRVSLLEFCRICDVVNVRLEVVSSLGTECVAEPLTFSFEFWNAVDKTGSNSATLGLGIDGGFVLRQGAAPVVKVKGDG